MIYGCAINLSNEFTNMSSSYIYIQQAGNSIGNLTLPLLTGFLVDIDPVWMCWMVLFCGFGCILSQLWIWRAGMIVQELFPTEIEIEIEIDLTCNRTTFDSSMLDYFDDCYDNCYDDFEPERYHKDDQITNF